MLKLAHRDLTLLVYKEDIYKNKIKINSHLKELLVIKKLIIKYSIKYYRKAIKKPHRNQRRT